MSCAHMATSVAMVICAHLPHPNEPHHGGSHRDLLETGNSVMESQLTVAPRMSIVIQYIVLQMPWSQSCAFEYSRGRDS